MKKENMKQLIFGIAIAATAISATVLSFVNLSDSISSSELSSSWMKNIDSNAYISEISIPGTHDSGALYSIGDLSGKCQDVSIKKQLQLGARFLDIRLKYTKNKFKIVHGIVDERADFERELKSCIDFLDKNPSETIIMSIKKEADGDQGFNEALEALIKNNSRFYTERTIPQLKDVRGKIVLFSRYSGNTIGLDASHNWVDPDDDSLTNTFEIVNSDETYHIQDYFKFNDVENKWSQIKECLEFSSSNTNPKILSINFLSGINNQGFPPSYSVPVAKYINNEFISYKNSFTKSGIVLFDFITEELANIAYTKNLQGA